MRKWIKNSTKTHKQKGTRHVFSLHKMRYFATCSFAFVYALVADLCETKTSMHYEIARITGSLILSSFIFLISFSHSLLRSLSQLLSHSLFLSVERVHFMKCYQMFHTSRFVRSVVRIYFAAHSSCLVVVWIPYINVFVCVWFFLWFLFSSIRFRWHASIFFLQH